MNRPFDIIKASGASPTKPPAEPLELKLSETRDTPFGPYLLSPELATSINVAFALDQPLLVTGEPGCGKTSMAWAVAEQMGTEVLEFHVKSTAVARDLLYTVDNLRRFHDASSGDDGARDASQYITTQALGQAIGADKSYVVLIDEIDKAPRDFPNDLLNELDRMAYQVPELTPTKHYKQKVQHFVLITSNSERRLPTPFLRRCAYVHLEFPEERALREIVAMHTEGPSESFISLAVARFTELREIQELVKAPATSELIGWVRVLHRMGTSESSLKSTSLGELPAMETLIKMLDDRKRLETKSP